MRVKSVSLRDAALRLGSIPQMKTRGKIADGALLGLLKAGDLVASIQVPYLQTPWIPVAPEYWMAVSSEKFREIRRINRRGGSYQIALSEISSSYIQILTRYLTDLNQQLNSQTILGEIHAALAVATQKFEAVLNDHEFCKYLDHKGFRENLAPPQDNRGKKEKTSWSHIAPILGAYLLSDKYRDGEKHEVIAQFVLDEAFNMGVKDPPELTTMLAMIGKMFQLVASFNK